MRTEVMTVTPAIASKWLASTTFRNRSVSQSVVNRYVCDIKNGLWLLNGESIVIDDNGNVIDGQHRLHAIIKSATPIQSVVVRGVDAATFHTFDIGKKRGHADVLSIAGYANANVLAAGLRLIHAVKTSKSIDMQRGSGSLSKTRVNVLDLVSEYPAAVQSAAYIKSAVKDSELARPGSFGVMVHYLFSEEDASAASEFFYAAFEGVPKYGIRCPTVSLRKKYGTIPMQKEMSMSFAFRLKVWRTAWDQFKRYCDSGRNQAARLARQTLNESR